MKEEIVIIKKAFNETIEGLYALLFIAMIATTCVASAVVIIVPIAQYIEGEWYIRVNGWIGYPSVLMLFFAIKCYRVAGKI